MNKVFGSYSGAKKIPFGPEKVQCNSKIGQKKTYIVEGVYLLAQTPKQNLSLALTPKVAKMSQTKRSKRSKN